MLMMFSRTPSSSFADPRLGTLIYSNGDLSFSLIHNIKNRVHKENVICLKITAINCQNQYTNKEYSNYIIKQLGH